MKKRPGVRLSGVGISTYDRQPIKRASWYRNTYGFRPVIRHELDAGIREYPQQGRRMALKQASYSVCPVYTATGVQQTHWRT